MTSAPSIYQQLLAADFERLGPILRHVHGPSPSVHARGRVSVAYGRGWTVRLLNRLMKVPPASEDVDLQLEIRRSANRETWIRSFAGKPLVTTQWAEDGLFVEAVGGVKMSMRLRIADGILHFDPVHTRAMGIKVPKWLQITVAANVREQEDGWRIFVETRSAVLGLLFRYSGFIRLEA
ncbi:MAG TPA: DUF4166 domain-containing protein [Bacteroidia bacterium]|nr:DUF4166 domain-containing protein [Bacteroidia bacterium]